MTERYLAQNPVTARPWLASEGPCALRAGGEVRPFGIHRMDDTGTLRGIRGGSIKGSDRLDRTYESAGGPAGGAPGA